MRRLILTLLFAATVMASQAYASEPYLEGHSFLALCYHNIEDEDPDQRFEGVTTRKLVEQLSWLKSDGYQAISIDDLLAAQQGRKPLPPKAMLLTFDDGYESFYTRVYPILRAFNYPAVIGVVDQWMEGSDSGEPQPDNQNLVQVHYGNTTMPRAAFLTWPQVREMEESGLVEVASHSDALHHGLAANPQGNQEPAAVNAGYDAKSGRYESAGDYKNRIETDAETSAQTIAQKTGRKPRVMIWPYGYTNQIAIAAEQQAGMPITFTLADGFATVDHLNATPRYLLNKNPEIGDFAIDIHQMSRPIPLRVVQADLDYIYDPDPAQLERNLDAFIARIYALRINTVFLQAFADPEGSGTVRQVYFPNRELPVRADLFNRVVWQLKTRAFVSVYGWLPVLSYDFGPHTQHVMKWNAATGTAEHDDKARASVFDGAARAKILNLFEDMARHAPIDGVLFHDDAVLSDFEDASPAALQAYKHTGLPASIAAIRADPAVMKKWTAFKTDKLIEFTEDLAKRVKRYRYPLKTARNIFAAPVQNPDSEEWFAQNYDKFLKAYDYTAIEAMPAMEKVPSAEAAEWLQKLIAAAATHPGALTRTVFELQAVDWREHRGEDRAIPAEKLGVQMDMLARNGAMNFGYYPDDFATDTPNAEAIHRHLSLQIYPYLP